MVKRVGSCSTARTWMVRCRTHTRRARSTTATSAADAQIHVLIQFEQDRLAEIEAIGFLTTSVIGDIAAGAIRVDSLPALKEHPAVVLAEVSRPPKIETDVSSAAINLFDPRTNASTIPGKGRGALIGVIDSGIEIGEAKHFF